MIKEHQFSKKKTVFYMKSICNGSHDSDSLSQEKFSKTTHFIEQKYAPLKNDSITKLDSSFPQN